MSVLKSGFQLAVRQCGGVRDFSSLAMRRIPPVSSVNNVCQPICRTISHRFSIPKPRLSPRNTMIASGIAAVSYVGFTEYYRQKQKTNGNYTEQLEWDPYTREIATVKGLPTAGQLVPPSTLDSVKISRRVDGPTKLPGLELTLFQYQTCPFCCKVRAFLDHYGVPYNVVEVNPVLRQQIKFTDYRKVPILLVNNEKEQELLQLNDSSLIISILTTYLLFNANYKDSMTSILDLYQNLSFSPRKREEVKQVVNRYFVMAGEHIRPHEFNEVDKLSEERRWRQWADSVLVHQLSPNVYRTFGEALDSFRYFSDVGRWEEYFPQWERLLVIYVGAFAMYLVGKRLKKKHGLKDDVRESLYDACKHWTKAIGKDRLFMGGERPNLADLAVFGVLNSIEGCAAFKDVLKQTNIARWYYAVKETCVHRTGSHLLKLAE